MEPKVKYFVDGEVSPCPEGRVIGLWEARREGHWRYHPSKNKCL